jgi:hypothetical protein
MVFLPWGLVKPKNYLFKIYFTDAGRVPDYDKCEEAYSLYSVTRLCSAFKLDDLAA